MDGPAIGAVPVGAPYGEVFAEEASMFGVLRRAGLAGAPEAATPDPIEAPDGELMLGLLPASVDSEGFLLQENMLAPGIFHPLLQPTWVPLMTSTTRASLFQCAILVRIANNPLIALNPVSNPKVLGYQGIRFVGQVCLGKAAMA